MQKSADIEATSETVYRRLRGMIVDANLAPGERLVQRKLADFFETSNIPVVEAIRRLERDGLVDGGAKWGGAQVKVWKQDDIRGLYLARAALEGVTCRLFAESATLEARRQLEESGQKFNELCGSGQHKKAIETDIALHTHIVRSSKSPSLCQMLESSCLITTAIWNSFKSRPLSSGPVGIHDGLIAVLNSGIPEAAEHAGRQHVLQALDQLMARFDSEKV